VGSLAVDFSLIRRELGWTPPFSLDEGLRATAAWYFSKRELDASRATGVSLR
jgi:nucleoside-diphosphate-sugar epimerase